VEWDGFLPQLKDRFAMWGALVVFGVGLIVNTIANVATDPTRIIN
jgi:hypothetical protein